MDKLKPTTRQESLESKEAFGTGMPAPSQGGRARGELAEKIGVRDEEKSANELPPAHTRVQKKDERREDGSKRRARNA